MANRFNLMEISGSKYYINSKEIFSSIGALKEDDILEAFEFAFAMTYGDGGEHRNHRSGGTYERGEREIFIDTLQGKMAKFAIYNELSKLNINVSLPDLNTYGLGQWDDCDFVAEGKKLAIKSTKYYGNLLLLETKDYDSFGRYTPNENEQCDGDWDLFMLVRMNPYCEEVYSVIPKGSHGITKGVLKNIVINKIWNYDIPGFITKNDLVFLMKNGYTIPKGALLNGRIPMDADNYYVQAGDLRPLSEFKNYLQ